MGIYLGVCFFWLPWLFYRAMQMLEEDAEDVAVEVEVVGEL
jgi:hypothetical protein